jgi:hypothetical protein
VDRTTPREGDTYEPNYNTESAAVINEGAYTARILPGESDYFAVGIKKGETVNVTAAFDHSIGDLDMDIEGPGYYQEMYSHSDNEQDAFTAPETGTYYIQVYGENSDTDSAPYTLYVDREYTPENLSVTVHDTEITPGGRATITYGVTARTSVKDITLSIEELPGSLYYLSETSPSASWDATRLSWRWDALAAGATKNVSLTFGIPDSAQPRKRFGVISNLKQGVATTVASDASIVALNEPESTAQPPIVGFEYIPRPVSGENITFDASGSTDPDGSIETYTWDFDGDGVADATGQRVTRSFSEAGSRQVELTVTDSDGRTNSTVLTIEVAETPSGVPIAAETTPAPPGGNATVTFTAENNRSNATALIVNLTALPEGFSIAGQSGDGGTWNANESKWLWQTVDAGGAKSSSVTLAVPENANGTYSVSAAVLDDDGVVNTTTVELRTTLSVPEAIDTNDDGEIGDFEILDAIELWRTNDEVAGTGGKTIGDLQILDLIEQWRTGNGS